MSDPVPPVPSEQTVADQPSRWRLDTRPLRQSRDFRLIFSSGLISYFGSMTTYVAIPFQIKELTGSLALAGLIGIAELVPLLVFGLWGGGLADAFDRKRLVLVSELVMLGMAVLLTLNALLPDPHVWPLFAVAASFAAADAVQRPALDAMVPKVVAYDQQSAAQALSGLRFEVGGITAPGLAGVILAFGDTWMAYAFDTATFAVSALLLARISHVSVPAGAAAASLRGIGEGLVYAWGRKDLLGTYTVDILAMFFCMASAIYPFVAVAYDAPWALGLLYVAEAVGALGVGLTSGWMGRVHRQGRAIALAAGTYGLAMLCFGLAPGIWVALGALVVAGAADAVSAIFRSTVWNQSIPDHLRGRLAGVELLSYSIGPTTGNGRAGLVAGATSIRTSIVSGAVLCIGSVALVTAVMRDFRAYDDRTNPHAVANRALSDG